LKIAGGFAKNDKRRQYQIELARWNELFEETDDSTRKAADGMIRKCGFFAFKVHPAEIFHPGKQTGEKPG
jgi:hypothetical protein